ncbi:MAG: hypothetical protein ACRD21_18385 [Vicinamibacteria bacterium]
MSGGEEPRWTRGGREILFLASAGVHAASIETSGKPAAEKPRWILPWKPPLPLLEGAYRKHYDATPGGERILVVESENDPESNRIHVVLNWLGEIE